MTRKDADRFNLKGRTLRDVEMTYPCFHHGEVESLTDPVDIMGRLQSGKKCADKEDAQIVAFIKTLTGDQPNFDLPILPPSTEKTPNHLTDRPQVRAGDDPTLAGRIRPGTAL